MKIMLFLMILRNVRGVGVIFLNYVNTHTTQSRSNNGWILTHGEADQICTESKTGSLAGSNTNGGRDSVKDGKDDRGEDGESRDLIQWQCLLWDKNGRRRNNETFDQVLNDAIDNFSKSVAHHDSILHLKKKTRQTLGLR